MSVTVREQDASNLLAHSNQCARRAIYALKMPRRLPPFHSPGQFPELTPWDRPMADTCGAKARDTDFFDSNPMGSFRDKRLGRNCAMPRFARRGPVASQVAAKTWGLEPKIWYAGKRYAVTVRSQRRALRPVRARGKQTAPRWETTDSLISNDAVSSAVATETGPLEGLQGADLARDRKSGLSRRRSPIF